MNGRKNRCVITDKYGNQAVSNVVRLVQKTDLKITTQPKDIAYRIGEKVSFKITAEGEGLKYQWQYSPDGGKSWANASSTSSEYSFTTNEYMNGRKNKCVITDKYGNQVVSVTVILRAIIKDDWELPIM